jgi:hypothetical protein
MSREPRAASYEQRVTRSFHASGRWSLSLLALSLVLLLTACGIGPSAALADVSLSGDTLHVGQRGSFLELRYTLGHPARVTIQVQPAAGGPAIPLRAEAERPAGNYYLRVDGIVPVAVASPGPETLQVQLVLPDGGYTLVLQAAPTDGTTPQTWQHAFTLNGAPAAAPVLQNVQANPPAISPNSDAIDDVASITFRLAQTSTTAITVNGPDNQRIPLQAPTAMAAGEHLVPFTGNDLFGKVLPDGPYTVTVRTTDLAGNAVEARLPITITGGGQPSLSLLSADFSPHALMLGNTLTVRMTVQNTGKVPLRTQGPDPGYTYTTNDVYSSVEGGQYTDKAGLWRVAVDWDANAGGGPLRYPFRWGFGHTLAPGETVTIDGHITILKQERQMLFFTGVLQEGVRIWLDRLAPATIDVSF